LAGPSRRRGRNSSQPHQTLPSPMRKASDRKPRRRSGAKTSASTATAASPAARVRGHATTSQRSGSPKSSKPVPDYDPGRAAARPPPKNRRGYCVSSASAPLNWRRTASHCREAPISGQAGRPSAALAEAVSPAEYAALQRATQYAHYTPEPIIRAL
jgi:hypothetical protein